MSRNCGHQCITDIPTIYYSALDSSIGVSTFFPFKLLAEVWLRVIGIGLTTVMPTVPVLCLVDDFLWDAVLQIQLYAPR